MHHAITFKGPFKNHEVDQWGTGLSYAVEGRVAQTWFLSQPKLNYNSTQLNLTKVGLDMKMTLFTTTHHKLNVSNISAVPDPILTKVLICLDMTCPRLIHTNLTHPNLINSDLTWPDLTWPDLTCPDLTCPNLTCPDLTYPDLTCSDLTCPYLTYSFLTCPDLTWPVMTWPLLTWPLLSDLTYTILYLYWLDLSSLDLS